MGFNKSINDFLLCWVFCGVVSLAFATATDRSDPLGLRKTSQKLSVINEFALISEIPRISLLSSGDVQKEAHSCRHDEEPCHGDRDTIRANVNKSKSAEEIPFLSALTGSPFLFTNVEKDRRRRIDHSNLR